MCRDKAKQKCACVRVSLNVFTTGKCLIMGAPEMPYGAEVSDREWTISLGSAEDDASGYPSA